MREFLLRMFSSSSSGLCGCVPFFLNAGEEKGLAGGRVVSESDIVTFPRQTPGFRGGGGGAQATPVCRPHLYPLPF